MKILPFYTSTGQRDAERVNSWSGLLCPDYKLLPFQIQRDALSSTGLTSAVLVDCDGAETDIFANLNQTVHEKTDYDFITYNGTPLESYISYGVYYLRASDGNTTWYSEWFNVKNIQPSLITGWDTETYSGWTVIPAGSYKDIGIAQAIAAGASIAVTNSFPVKTGEVFVLTSEFNISAGSDQAVFEILSSGSAISNAVALVDGEVEVNELIVTKTDPAATLRITSSAAVTFSCDRLSLRRKAGDYVYMEFTNTNDIQGQESIFYASGFTQQVYLDTSMAPPGHEMVETGEEKNGVFQAEKMVDKLVYSLVAYESWSLFRALRILPLHDDIEIIDRTGQVYTPQQGNVRVAIDWGTFDTGSLRIDWNELGDAWTSNMDNIV